MVFEPSGASNMAWAAWNLHFFVAATYKLAFWDFKINIKTKGKIINLFKKEPFVIDHNTGSSREDENPEDFSALTAKSSARIPAVFFADILVIVRTSSIKTIMSSRIAKKPEWWVILMFIPLVNYVVGIWIINRMVKGFGKSEGFTIGMIFLGFIFYPILAFGDVEYDGNRLD